MHEADSTSVHRGMDGSRIIFLVALTLLAGYFVMMASAGSTTPFVVVSGSSMEPTYHAGDLLLVKSAVPASITPGEVVVFHTPRKGVNDGLPSRIAHRVVGIEPVDGMIGYVTKGDNSDRDAFVVSSNLLIGTVRANLGPIGKPLALIGNLKLLLIIGIPLAVAGGVFWLLTREEDDEAEIEEVPASGQSTNSEGLDPRRVVPPLKGSPELANFVTPYDNRVTDRKVHEVKQWMLNNSIPPNVRQAFDDVTGRLDAIRSRREARDLRDASGGNSS